VKALKGEFFGCRHMPNGKQHAGYPILEMSINRASTMCGHAFWIIKWLFNDICPHWTHRPPFHPKMLTTTLRVSRSIDRQRSVNHFRSCILHNPTAVQ